MTKPIPEDDHLKYKGGHNKPDIKIFVSHRIDQNNDIIENPLYINVRCGAVFDKVNINNFFGDDTGDNISEKRLSLSEYTVMYWAWKNIDADYYGLCHYRRYLGITNNSIKSNMPLKQTTVQYLTESSAKELGLCDFEKMTEIISKHDMCISHEYDMYKDAGASKSLLTIKDLWLEEHEAYLKEDDFDALISIIKELRPEYYNDTIKYMKGHKFVGFNLFVMKKDLFNDLCEFLFPILFRFEEHITRDNYSDIMNRAASYAGEWLYSIWLFHKKKARLKIATFNIISFEDTKHVSAIQPKFSGKNSTSIVLAANDYNRSYLSVVIQSMIEHMESTDELDIIILQKGASLDKWKAHLIDEECNAIISMANSDNISIRFYNPKYQLSKISCNCDQPPFEENLYLAFLPWILKNFNNVVFLSDSVLIENSIKRLLPKEDVYVAAAIDPYMASIANGYEKNVRRGHQIRPFKKQKYFSSELVYLNLEKIRNSLKFEDCIRLINKYELNNTSDIFNAIYSKYSQALSSDWNVIYPYEPQYYFIDEYLPTELKSKNVSAIVLQSLSGISRVPSLETTRKFWGYARKTPFYEQLILQGIPNYGVQMHGTSYYDGLRTQNPEYKETAQKLAPIGSVRRKVIDKIIPKHTHLRGILKRLMSANNNIQ